MAYIRGAGSENPVLIVLNFSNQDRGGYGIGMDEGIDWKLRVNSVAKEYDSGFSEIEVTNPKIIEEVTDHRVFTGKIDIPGYAALIFTV